MLPQFGQLTIALGPDAPELDGVLDACEFCMIEEAGCNERVGGEAKLAGWP